MDQDASDTTIRPATPDDADGMAEVSVAAWRETYGGLLPQPTLDGMSVPDRAAWWRQRLSSGSPDRPRPRAWVAERGGRIVGFVDGGPARAAELGQEMEVYAIYLLDSVKRQGLGRRLLRAIFRDFVAHGATSAGLWVLRDNHGARRFYEACGAVPTTERTESRPGYALTEVGYAWRDLRAATAE
ncbi:MAG: N-acetyltransferase family protein [Gemmatimonas sp.]